MNPERRVLGKTGLEVSVIGFGGSETGYGGTDSRALGQILAAAHDSGVNLIDTAECYGDGELQLGRALGGRRKDFVLLTKCGHARTMLGSDWSPRMLEKSIDQSLRNLGTDHVDVMQFHSPEVRTLRDSRVLEVLTRARDAGKARFIGCSADGAGALEAVAMGVFDTLQISISIADQEALDGALPQARERGMGVIAKRPIANAAWLPTSRDGYSAPYRQRLGKLEYDFLKREDGAASALRFTLSSPGVTCAIVGTTKASRIAENMRAARLGGLPSADYERIRARWRSAGGASWPGQR